MSTPGASVEWLLARAAVRSTGLLHIVSRRNSGALNPVCGARTLLSERIEEQHHLDDVTLLCDGCGTIAASIGGTIHDGVALLLGLSTAATTARLLELPIVDVNARATHPRRGPGNSIEALVDSVRERGIVTPLLVRRHGRKFEIIDGARRLYAATIAGLITVPAVVRDATDQDVTVDSLVANLHTETLNPIDLAHAYRHAIATLGLASKAELGRLLGVSREQVSNTIRLLDLPEEEQARIVAGDITATDGRKMLAAATTATERLTDVSALLGQLLAAKVAVTARGGRTRIVIDVADGDANRILGQLGAAA